MSIQFFVAYLFGARFDLVFKEVWNGNIWAPSSPEQAQRIVDTYDKGEL